MAVATQIGRAARIKLPLILTLALATVGLAPATAHANEGCSAWAVDPEPSGQIKTKICGGAYISSWSDYSFLPELDFRWRYTRCVLHQAVQIGVGSTPYRRAVNCDFSIQELP